MNKKSSFVLANALLIVTVLFQNCGRFAPISQNIFSASSFSRQHKSCMLDASVQACIIKKSPVHVLGTISREQLVKKSSINALIHQPVEITGLDDSGFLQNSTFSVQVRNGERAVSTDSQWKLLFDDNSSYQQLHTYYWINYAVELMLKRTGQFYAEGKDIQIVVDAEKTGWSMSENRIELEGAADERQAALDASISLNLLAHANLSYATDGEIYNLSGVKKHKNCEIGDGPTYINDCCVSKLGCSKAIASGQADYFTALVFSEDPSIGETWANRSAGMETCGMDRNVSNHANLSAKQAYENCADKGAAGQVFNMGLLYASIWWEVRKTLASEEEDSLEEFDTLYMEHLAVITGSDDFESIFAKVLEIDVENHRSRFSEYIEVELKRRGL